MASDPSQFAKSVAAEMSKLQADGSRDSLQQLKGVQQGIKADARAVLVDQKAGVAQAQEMLRRETAIAKEKVRGESLVAAERAKADIQAAERAKKRQETDASAAKRKQAADERATARISAKRYKSVGDFLEKGGEKIISASQFMVAAAAAVATAGAKFGIDVSSAKRDAEESLRNLTKNFGGEKRGVEQGDVAFRVTMSLAGEKGVDPQTAMQRVRGLIDSKFDRKDTEIYFRVSADLDAVKGGGTGDALLGQIETLKRLDAKLQDQRGRRDYKAIQLEKGNAQATALDELAMSGVKTSEVLQLLANKGEGLKSVSMRLRRGKIDMDDFLHAAAKVAGKGMEGVAGRGWDATVNRIKIGVKTLFSDWDLSPLDEAGDKLDAALKGSDGAELKRAIGEIGKEFLRFTKDLTKEDISTGFKTAAEAAKQLADAVRTARDLAVSLAGAAKNLGFGKLEEKDSTRGVNEIDARGRSNTVGTEAVHERKRTIIPYLWEITEYTTKGIETGKAVMDGMAKGVADNAGKPAAAVGDAVGGMIEAGNAKAGIHSPSKVAAQQGKYYDEGWALGIKQNADMPARAAAGMVGGITGAGATAGGFGGGGASTGGGGGGNVYHFSPNIVLPAGSSASTGATVNSAFAAAYPVWLSWARQRDRDQQETRGRV